ncbi:hypothetical protein D3C77_505600 [compost metagenome]
MRQVGLWTTFRLVLCIGPLDHRVCHKRRNVTLEAFGHLLLLLHGKVSKYQAFIKLGGIEQPDHDLHQDAVRHVQARLDVALDKVLVLG